MLFRTHVKPEMREKANQMYGSMDGDQAAMIEHDWHVSQQDHGNISVTGDGSVQVAVGDFDASAKSTQTSCLQAAASLRSI